MSGMFSSSASDAAAGFYFPHKILWGCQLEVSRAVGIVSGALDPFTQLLDLQRCVCRPEHG